MSIRTQPGRACQSELVFSSSSETMALIRRSSGPVFGLAKVNRGATSARAEAGSFRDPRDDPMVIPGAAISPPLETWSGEGAEGDEGFAGA
jgi:hypothetical protein